MSLGALNGKGPTTLGIDRTAIRLAVVGVLVFAAFTALFSRLWYLQVLASEDYLAAAKENRRRVVLTEPSRGRILDRDGDVLVDNRLSLAITIDREVVDEPSEINRTIRRLAALLVVEAGRTRRQTKRFDERVRTMKKELRRSFQDPGVSPYKPVAVAYDVDEDDVVRIEENPEDWRGVGVDQLPVREYPQGELAAHVLGYVGEINADELKSKDFKGYRAGDIIGKAGVERTWDRHLRGTPGRELVIVNSAGDVIDSELRQESASGKDLVLSLDADIQRVTERALENGVRAARGAYLAPGGAVVVMDPDTGGVVAMASYPDYDPAILADGLTFKEEDRLGAATPDDSSDDALVNRAIRAGVPPGSTFKIVTAGAAMATDIADVSTTLPCPPSVVYPPDDPYGTQFNNWTSADLGLMGFPRSLEVSCDTFYYELGWRMDQAFGPRDNGGDGSERFQEYVRRSGVGRPTGIDLPYEYPGVVPDERWCEVNEDLGYCPDGWLPGYTVNMSIGQGDLKTNPLQMAIATSAVVNGGNVMQPRLAHALSRQSLATGKAEVVRELEPKVVSELGLDDAELGVIRQGMVDVVTGAAGTAREAFSGFPFDVVTIGGKTGTAQIGSVESGLNYAWFISYAPVDDPEYVIAVYLDRAGHGGESAAPIARQIWEGIYGIDKDADVHLSEDASN
ncbi:MAG TPA: penicillin-binding protein 2 [Actinomycetota bacterium]|nr:penicillin-binding protein 2 [Actinomycetota bacterium]